MADGRTPKVSFGEALTKTVFLARRLRPLWEGQKMVGVLLPPSIPGALVNWAAMLQGKVDLFLDGGIGDRRKRWRISRLQTNTPCSHTLRDVQRFLQDILRFAHCSLCCNNVTLALLHLGL